MNAIKLHRELSREGIDDCRVIDDLDGAFVHVFKLESGANPVEVEQALARIFALHVHHHDGVFTCSFFH